MPITDHIERIQCAAITVLRGERQRRELETQDLEASIQANGLLNPIIVAREPGPDGTERIILKAGERRLKATMNLGYQTILVRYANDLSPVESQIIELEENIKRQDLDWQDLARATQRIHQLHMQMDSDWTMGETAESCSLTTGTVSMYLRVAADLTDERVSACTGMREAYNLLLRRDQRAMGNALEELIGTANDVTEQALEAPDREPAGAVEGHSSAIARLPTTPNGTTPIRAPIPIDPSSILLEESFLHWAPKYTGKRFNLIHCDFPYGINVFAGPQGGGRDHSYQDTRDLYQALTLCLCQNLDKLMAASGHLMFWYSNRPAIQEWTLKAFAEHAPSLKFVDYPLIWVKSDNAGIASDAKRNPRHIYETCLFASRGARQIIEIRADAYSAPTDKKWHPSTKPIPMLRHFMAMVCDDNTTLLDPTCGSGSALQAAASLGAARVLGMDADAQAIGLARQSWREAQSLRMLSRRAAE